MSIVLKNRIKGYYYINASKDDKQVFVYFQFSQTEAYIYNFIFPKCRVSYVFFFINEEDNNQLYISYKAATSVAEAMNQPNFSIREPMQVVVIEDVTKKTINFISVDQTDKTFTDPLFDPNCAPTEAEKVAELAVRQSVIEGNAGTNLNVWFVDGLMAGTMSAETAARMQLEGGDKPTDNPGNNTIVRKSDDNDASNVLIAGVTDSLRSAREVNATKLSGLS